jgi:hypothetical protein
MFIQAIVGGLAFLAGVVAISRPTKNLHWAIKYTPIFLCSLGIFNVWQYFAQSIPVVADAKVTILQVESNKMYISVDPQFARRCNLHALDIHLVDSSKIETRVAANFVNPKDFSQPNVPYGWHDANIFEIKVNPGSYESFYFLAYDRCAFDVHVRSEFGHTLIPPKFNSPLPTKSASAV